MGQIWLVSNEFSVQCVLKHLADLTDLNSISMALCLVNWRAHMAELDILLTWLVMVSSSFMQLLSFVHSWNAAGPPLSLGALGLFVL